jgi:hypothetical protein
VRNELALTRASSAPDTSISRQGDESTLSQAPATAADVPLRVCQVASDLVLPASALAGRPGAAPEQATFEETSSASRRRSG